MIVVYEKPDCVQCRLTKKHLYRNGAHFQVRQIDDEVLAKAEDAGITAAPVVMFGSWIVGGFQPEILNEMIAEQKAVV